MPRCALAAFAVTLLIAGSMMYVGPAHYADGPPPGHTGGFGEPTCHQCHFDLPGNDPLLVIAIDGLPPVHVPGEEYDLEMIVAHPQMKAGGFQFSARYESGEGAGRQAGRITSPRQQNQSTPVRTITDSAGVVYVSHRAPVEGDSVAWSVRWTAPQTDDPVVFHMAANASNYDDSEFGDRVGSASFLSVPRRSVVGDHGNGKRSSGAAQSSAEGLKGSGSDGKPQSRREDE